LVRARQFSLASLSKATGIARARQYA